MEVSSPELAIEKYCKEMQTNIDRNWVLMRQFERGGGVEEKEIYVFKEGLRDLFVEIKTKIILKTGLIFFVIESVEEIINQEF